MSLTVMKAQGGSEETTITYSAEERARGLQSTISVMIKSEKERQFEDGTVHREVR